MLPTLGSIWLQRDTDIMFSSIERGDVVTVLDVDDKHAGHQFLISLFSPKSACLLTYIFSEEKDWYDDFEELIEKTR